MVAKEAMVDMYYLPWGQENYLTRIIARLLPSCELQSLGTRLKILPSFQLKKARLRIITWVVAVSACLIASHRWQLQERVPITGNLVTQFLIGRTLQTMFKALKTLLVDIHQDGPSTAQAACNLFRCELAAGYRAALYSLLIALKAIRTFVFFGAVVFLSVVLLWTLEWRGMAWGQCGLLGRGPDPDTVTTIATDMFQIELETEGRVIVKDQDVILGSKGQSFPDKYV